MNYSLSQRPFLIVSTALHWLLGRSVWQVLLASGLATALWTGGAGGARAQDVSQRASQGSSQGSSQSVSTPLMDSLQALVRVYDAERREDTNLVRWLNKLAWEYESRDVERAWQTAERAEAIAERLGDKSGVAQALNIKGLVEFDRGSYDEALEFHLKALALRERLGDKRAQARSLNNIGIVYRHQGKYELAVEYYTKSLVLKESIGDKKGMASSMSNIATVYSLQGKYEAALEYELKSLDIEQELRNVRGLAVSLSNIGAIYMKQNKLDRALEYFNKSLLLKKDLGDSDGMIPTLTNIGAVYRRQGNTTKAVQFYRQALELTRLQGNKDGEIFCHIEIAELYKQTGNFLTALDYAQRALATAENIGARPRESELLQQMAELYRLMGSHQEALATYKRFIALRDSIVSAESVLNIAKMRAKYESDRKDQEIQLLNKTQEVQRLTVNSLAVGIAFLVMLSMVLVRMYRQRKRSEQNLREKNEEILRQQKILQDQTVEIELANTTLQEKNVELEAAHERSEQLLLNVLPEPIAQRLKSGERTIADYYESVTVLFADIVGFTNVSANTTPERLVEGLNTLFVRFDELARKYGLEKIKTIGDAYMVAGGLPQRSHDHCERVALFALEMLRLSGSSSTLSNINHLDTFALRIGMHTGSAIAGVIGTSKFSYDLWGDTVNIASRMETYGVAGKIHTSDAVFAQLNRQYIFEERGVLDIKGKGTMNTYFLLDQRH